MGRSRGWSAEQTGRASMRSPGRPGVNQRDAKRAFWEHINLGLSSEDAALACGVSQPVGTRWFREAGGMAPTNLAPDSGRYLSFTEREELALLRAQLPGDHEFPLPKARGALFQIGRLVAARLPMLMIQSSRSSLFWSTPNRR